MRKHSIRPTSFMILAGAGLMLTAAPAFAASTGSIKKTEASLAAAGFQARPANTPKRQDMLKRMPADKLSTRTKGDTIVYVYPDPKLCKCIFVGDGQAYSAYQKAASQKKLADEIGLAAQEYNDPEWDWGAWGPWTGRLGGFGRWRGW